MIIFEIYNFNRKIEGVYVDVLDKKKTVKPFETASDLAQAIFNLNQDLMYKTTEVSFEKKKYTQLTNSPHTTLLKQSPLSIGQVIGVVFMFFLYNRTKDGGIIWDGRHAFTLR